MGDHQAGDGLTKALHRSDQLLASACALLQESDRRLRASDRRVQESQSHLDAAVARTRPGLGTPFAHSPPRPAGSSTGTAD